MKPSAYLLRSTANTQEAVFSVSVFSTNQLSVPVVREIVFFFLKFQQTFVVFNNNVGENNNDNYTDWPEFRTQSLAHGNPKC